MFILSKPFNFGLKLHKLWQSTAVLTRYFVLLFKCCQFIIFQYILLFISTGISFDFSVVFLQLVLVSKNSNAMSFDLLIYEWLNIHLNVLGKSWLCNYCLPQRISITYHSFFQPGRRGQIFLIQLYLSICTGCRDWTQVNNLFFQLLSGKICIFK